MVRDEAIEPDIMVNLIKQFVFHLEGRHAGSNMISAVLHKGYFDYSMSKGFHICSHEERDRRKWQPSR